MTVWKNFFGGKNLKTKLFSIYRKDTYELHKNIYYVTTLGT